MQEKFKSLLSKQELILKPSTDVPRKIVLKPDGTTGDFLVKRWSLLGVGEPTMLLQVENGDFYARLDWNTRQWFGQDKNGYTEIEVSNPKEFNDAMKVTRQVQTFVPPDRIDVKKEKLDLGYNIEDYFTDTPKESNTAAAIIGCNRWGYFKQVVDSLQSQLDEYPIFLFLDKPEDPSHFTDTKRQEDYAKEVLGNLTVIKRPLNWGCGMNIIDVREQLLNKLKYERLFVFEDDLVVSPNYVSFCNRLWDWSQDNYDNVGAVQGWSKCLMTRAEKQKQLSEVSSMYTTNLWGYLLSRDCWQSIRLDMLEYANKIKNNPYASRDHADIKRFFTKFRQNAPTLRGQSLFKDDRVSEEHRIRMIGGNCPTGQDGLTYLTMYHHGWKRLAPVVNRALYIGKTGIHSFPEYYERQRMHLVNLDNFGVDSRIKNFKPREATTIESGFKFEVASN